MRNEERDKGTEFGRKTDLFPTLDFGPWTLDFED
jgi:hypothetical protein